jgi:hypothetical protein
MLCMLGSVKVLVSKEDLRDYRGIGVKHTMVTAIECISANGSPCYQWLFGQPLPIEAIGPRFPPRGGTILALDLDTPTQRSASRAQVFQGGVNPVVKEHFTLPYSSVRDNAFSKRNIINAWGTISLFPLNRDRILRRTPKPPAQLIVPGPGKIRRDSGVLDEVLQSPTTPVLAEALCRCIISLNRLSPKFRLRRGGGSP